MTKAKKSRTPDAPQSSPEKQLEPWALFPVRSLEDSGYARGFTRAQAEHFGQPDPGVVFFWYGNIKGWEVSVCGGRPSKHAIEAAARILRDKIEEMWVRDRTAGRERLARISTYSEYDLDDPC